MTNDVSSERRVEVSAAKVVAMMRAVKENRGRIAFVAGPVVVHSGGVEYFCDLLRQGYVDVLLSGNALAVHDIEHSLFGTSLGIDLNAGVSVDEGASEPHAGDQCDLQGRGVSRGRGVRGP